MSGRHAFEIREALALQPVAKLQKLAELLGWKGLRAQGMYIDDPQLESSTFKSGVVIYYMTTDEKFNLQINCYPHGQQRQFQATVKASRYGIFNVGWHEFKIGDDDAELTSVAARLRPHLQRSQFKDRRWRCELQAYLAQQFASVSSS